MLHPFITCLLIFIIIVLGISLVVIQAQVSTIHNQHNLLHRLHANLIIKYKVCEERRIEYAYRCAIESSKCANAMNKLEDYEWLVQCYEAFIYTANNHDNIIHDELCVFDTNDFCIAENALFSSMHELEQAYLTISNTL